MDGRGNCIEVIEIDPDNEVDLEDLFGLTKSSVELEQSESESGSGSGSTKMTFFPICFYLFLAFRA